MGYSMSLNPVGASVWFIQYNPDKDLGFRLYNGAGKCFLASSYRSFPDYDGERVNDTILHQLRLELEATCTAGPTREASTLYAVDGKLSHLPIGIIRPFMKSPV